MSCINFHLIKIQWNNEISCQTDCCGVYRLGQTMGTSTWLFQVILVGFTLPPPPASPHRFVTKSTEVSDALCPLPLSLPCRYLLALCTLLTVSAEFSISFQFSITARKMLLITITRLKLTHCHQLRAGRAKFHHPASLLRYRGTWRH